MNNLQSTLDSIKNNPLFSIECIEDLEYGLSLGSSTGPNELMQIWLNYSVDNVDESCQDAAYYRTIKYIYEHTGVMN